MSGLRRGALDRQALTRVAWRFPLILAGLLALWPLVREPFGIGYRFLGESVASAFAPEHVTVRVKSPRDARRIVPNSSRIDCVVVLKSEVPGESKRARFVVDSILQAAYWPLAFAIALMVAMRRLDRRLPTKVLEVCLIVSGIAFLRLVGRVRFELQALEGGLSGDTPGAWANAAVDLFWTSELGGILVAGLVTLVLGARREPQPDRSGTETG